MRANAKNDKDSIHDYLAPITAQKGNFYVIRKSSALSDSSIAESQLVSQQCDDTRSNVEDLSQNSDNLKNIIVDKNDFSLKFQNELRLKLLKRNLSKDT